ncbi:MAG: hypothetical protein IKR26_00425 [Lachnospiraceae bacterium]|nr:hypothetical protein [Lachnospiraceae bacterium]
MRTFKTIESNISEQKKKIIKLQSKKEDARYKKTSFGIGKGIRAFIWGIMASGFVFLYEAMVFVSLKNEETALWLVIMGAIFLLLALIAAIRYLNARISLSAAMVFTIISAAVSLLLSIELLNGLSEKNYLIQLLGDYADVVEKAIGAPIDALIKASIYSNGALLIPVGVIFLGSFVKLIREKRKKKDCQRNEAKLSEEIADCEKELDLLIDEMESTKKEAKILFSEAKKQKDRAQMEELARIGLADANNWIKKDNKRLGKEIFEEEIKKDKPNREKIEQAADLGCPEACVYCGEVLLYAEGDYTNEEKTDLLLKAKDFFKRAINVGFVDGDFYYLYVKSKTEKFTKAEWKEMLNSFRKMKESGLLGEKAEELCDIRIKSCIETIDWIQEQEENESRNKTSSGTSMLPSEKPLSQSELAFLNEKVCLGLYNPSAIDNYSGLTTSQKEQLRAYNRIYGD